MFSYGIRVFPQYIFFQPVIYSVTPVLYYYLFVPFFCCYCIVAFANIYRLQEYIVNLMKINRNLPLTKH